MHLRTDPRAATKLEELGAITFYSRDYGRRRATGGFPYNRGMPGSEPSVHAMVTNRQRRLLKTGKIDVDQLGFIDRLVDIAGNFLTPGGQGPADVAFPPGAPLPGTEQGVPRHPGSVTTVSPSIQTQVSPQISPTMVQQQSSPGASVGSAPTQFMPGGQSAETGTTPNWHYGAPGTPGVTPSLNPLQPYGVTGAGNYVPAGPDPGQYSWRPDVPEMIRASQRGPEIPWLPIALVAAGGAVAFALNKRKKKS